MRDSEGNVIDTTQVQGTIYVVADMNGIKYFGASQSLLPYIKDQGQVLKKNLSSNCWAEWSAMDCTGVQNPTACLAIKAAKAVNCAALTVVDALKGDWNW